MQSTSSSRSVHQQKRRSARSCNSLGLARRRNMWGETPATFALSTAGRWSCPSAPTFARWGVRRDKRRPLHMELAPGLSAMFGAWLFAFLAGIRAGPRRFPRRRLLLALLAGSRASLLGRRRSAPLKLRASGLSLRSARWRRRGILLLQSVRSRRVALLLPSWRGSNALLRLVVLPNDGILRPVAVALILERALLRHRRIPIARVLSLVCRQWRGGGVGVTVPVVPTAVALCPSAAPMLIPVRRCIGTPTAKVVGRTDAGSTSPERGE